MAIDIDCPGCGKTFSVADSAIGKKGVCPHCDTFVVAAKTRFGAAKPSAGKSPAWTTGSVFPVHEGHSGPVHSVAVSLGGHLALSGGQDATIRLWDVDTGRQELLISTQAGPVRSVAFSPGGNYFASGGDDAKVHIFRLSNGKRVRSFEGHTDSVTSVAFCPRGSFLLSASMDKTVRVWDLSSGKCVKILKKHKSAVTALACDPRAEFFLSAGYDRLVRQWKIPKWKASTKFKGHGGPVLALAVSPDGDFAISGSADRTAAVWDIVKRRSIRILKGHQAPVHAVALSHDNALAATAAADWTLRIWDLDAPKTRFIIDNESNSITALAFDFDTPLLLAADNAGHVTLYNALEGACVRHFGGAEGAVTVLCPHCRRELPLPISLIGESGHCPDCAKPFRAVRYSPENSQVEDEHGLEAIRDGLFDNALKHFAAAMDNQCDNYPACLEAISTRYRMASDLADSSKFPEAVTHLQAGLDLYRRGTPWPAKYTAESQKAAYETAFLAAKVCRNGLADLVLARRYCQMARDFFSTPEVEDLLSRLPAPSQQTP